MVRSANPSPPPRGLAVTYASKTESVDLELELIDIEHEAPVDHEFGAVRMAPLIYKGTPLHTAIRHETLGPTDHGVARGGAASPTNVNYEVVPMFVNGDLKIDSDLVIESRARIHIHKRV